MANPLGSVTFGPAGSFQTITQISPFSPLTAPYSLTGEFIFTLTADPSIPQGNGRVTMAIPNVPEPSTWAMMLLSFAGLGFAFASPRRR